MHAISLAPAPDGFVWCNVGNSERAIDERRLVADGLLCWFAVLYTPLVTLLQLLSNLSEMAEVFPFLRPFARERRYDYARALVTGYLPVVLMLALLAVLPYFLEAIAVRYVGLKTKASVLTSNDRYAICNSVGRFEFG